MKRKVTSRSRLSGIAIGFILTFFVFVFSLTSIITNGDFWLKQNDKYHHQQNLNLASSDDYSILYHNYIALLKGDKNDFTVTEKGNPQDYTSTYISLGGYFGSESRMDCEKSFSLSEKYLDTVSAIEKEKYSTVNFDNKFFIEFYCQSANESFGGVKLNDIKITDGNGKAFDLLIKDAKYIADGTINLKNNNSDGEITFTPKSTSERIRIYLSGAEIKDIALSFNISAINGGGGVNVRFSYEDVFSAEAVADIIGPEINPLTDGEKEQFLTVAGINTALEIISWVLLVAAVVIFIYTLNREGRESLFGMGVYTLIVTIFLALLISVLGNVVPAQWGFNLVFNFEEGSTSALVVGQGFMNDFVAGFIRFFDFLMLAPVFIGYMFVKKSKKKHYDPNEDYLYQ